MKHITRKTLGALLALVMVIGLLPGISVTAYAWDGDPYASLVNTTTVVKFNGHDWYLIEDNATSETEGTVTLLAADTSFGAYSFDATNLHNKYSTSMVKTYLDGMTETGGAFADVADAIETVTVTTDNDTDVTAKLYLLSKSEAGALPVNVLMLGNFTNAGSYSGAYWLRSPRPNDGMDAAYVSSSDGTIINGTQVHNTLGVRPALKLNLSKVTFDSDTKTFTVGSATISERPAYQPSAPSSALTVTSEIGTITRVTVDGKAVDSKYYFVSGSNVVLSDEFMRSLSNGTHTIILYDGVTYATATWTVTGNATPTITAPKTGDPGVAIYGLLAVSSTLGLAWMGKKRKDD